MVSLVDNQTKRITVSGKAYRNDVATPTENDGTDRNHHFLILSQGMICKCDGMMMTERLDAEKLYRHLLIFLSSAKEDARITSVHISLYTSLVWFCQHRECIHPFTVFSHELMPLCKVSGTATYHKCIRELHQYHYIRYIPSNNRFVGSLVYLSATIRE